MTLGEMIKSFRTETGYSMDDFAKSSGLSKAYVSILERNRNPVSGKPVVPSLKTIKSVSTVLGVELDDILQKLDPEQKISLGIDDNIIISLSDKETRQKRAISEFRIGRTALFPDDADAEKTLAEFELLGYEIDDIVSKDGRIKVADKRTEEVLVVDAQDFKAESHAPIERAQRISKKLQKEKDTLYALYQLADERDQEIVQRVLSRYEDDLVCKTYDCEKHNPKE